MTKRELRELLDRLDRIRAARPAFQQAVQRRVQELRERRRAPVLAPPLSTRNGHSKPEPN